MTPVVVAPLRRRALIRAGRGLRAILSFPALPGAGLAPLRPLRLAAAGWLGSFVLVEASAPAVSPPALGPSALLFAPDLSAGDIGPATLASGALLYAPTFLAPGAGSAASYGGNPITYGGSAVTYGA